MEKLISSKIVSECPIFKVEEAEAEFEDGELAKRWYLIKNDAVAVMCIQDNKVIMLREYRSASQTVEWRIPAGGVEEGETPEDAAKREVEEETGLTPLDLKLIKTFKNPSSWVKQTTHLYKATKFEEHKGTRKKERQLVEIKKLETQEIKKLIEHNEIPNNITKLLKFVLHL